ncbi:hypothetical protein [Hamadaea tsunoensis]|uniref:hypothetical protein n=1 Tax=Hamadaea tsunoensis TaxID=53368 RepID=UPI0004194C10|nr:hypothetical protein [Hamadaea tsunoensis]
MSENPITELPRRRRGLLGLPGNEKPRWQRRQEKIRDEIARNRRGEYTVPTWVLVAALVGIIGGFALLIAFLK